VRTLPIRTVLVCTAVGCLVLLYVVWWTTYAGIHFEPRFTQQPPGMAGRVQGTEVRLVSLTRTDVLTDQSYGGEPEVAEPGATWVVAVLEATQQPGAPAFYCPLELVDPELRRWEAHSVTGRTLPSCPREELTTGQPMRFETIFLVPERYAERIAGVAVLDQSAADRTAVLTPPA
jgi:hypothetical protein